MGLFSKEQCSFCDNKVGFFSRKKLVNNEGYVCKECEKKCSSLINVSHFTKDELQKHMEYMEKENKLYEEAFEPIDKKSKERFVCISTGVEFADEIAMFRYISPNADKKIYKELFRCDQIKNYEPYYKENTNSNGGKKYAEVGLTIHLNCSRPKFGEAAGSVTGVGSRNFHPYVHEIQVPTARNVDDFSSVGLKNYLDKMFGVYEDTSLVGGIKSSIVGTNKEREQMKVAVEGVKTLGNLAKAKITGSENDSSKAQDSINTLKDDALDLATHNRASLSKIANEVEDRILGDNKLL